MAESVLPLIFHKDKDFDPYLKFIQLGPTALQLARFMMGEAYHPRVKVGSAVYAESKKYYGLFPAANQNLGKGPNDTKACAEEIGLMKVFGKNSVGAALGFNKVHGIFTVGTVQADSTSGMETPTLHTCNVERTLIPQLWEEGKIDGNLPLVMGHPTEPIWEIYPAFPFVEMHHRRATDQLRSYNDPQMRQWQVGEVYYLRETARQLALGQEPDGARIAHAAVIGQYAIGA